jgi:hypothetical protein
VGTLADDTFKYNTGKDRLVEGTPERPRRPGQHWRIDSIDPASNTTDEGNELFFMLETVDGTYEKVEGLEEYQAVWVPRPADHPAIQRVTLKYLDSTGTYRDAIKRDNV